MWPRGGTCGVYLIGNKVDHKVYIGGTKWIEQRWSWHKLTLRRGNHHCKPLQEAWNMYGEKNFFLRILIITELDDKNRENYEAFFLSKFDSYNIRPAANRGGFTVSEETKQRMSESAYLHSFTPGESEFRSLRAIQQHRNGKFGRQTWKKR